MFASDLKILTVSATTIPTTVINNKSPIMVTAQETLEYSSCFQGDSFKGRRQQSYEHQHQGKQQQSTKTKFSHNSNKFQTQHQQKYHNYSSNSSTNNHNNKSRKKHYNNNINSTSMNHKKYYHQQQQTPQQLHYEQHQHQYHLATKSGANNKNNNSNNNNCLIKNQNYTAVDLLIHTNNNRNGSQPELSSSTIASCSQSTSTDQQQTIIYEQKEAKQVPLKTSQTANSLSAVLITTTTTASSTHTRASCISCWTNLTKLSPQTPLANLKNNKSALYQQQQKSSNFHTRSIAFSSTNSGSNLQDFVAVALAATAASKCSFNASQNSSAKTSHQYASNGSTGTSKRKSFWKSSTVVGSGGGGSAGAGATANSTQSPKQKKTIVGALDKASLQENTFQTQHIGNKSNSQKGRGGVSTNQHQFVVVEKSAMTTALAGGTTVSAVSTPTTTTATSAITERHTSTSVITPAIAGAPAPNLSNSSSNSSLSTSAFIADSQFTQEQVKQGGRQSPEGNVLSGNTTIDNNSLNLKNSGVISAENFIPTTTTATPRSSSASSSPGSGASSSNSYTLDFLHSVGVQMTGGANLAALKANNNMSNMRSSSLTGSTTTLYSNHTVGASPVRNSYTFAAMAASQHQQHYMFGGGGTGNGNGTATSSGHHYHQSHHHHPPQLTVASFLQKDLLGETLLSSSTAAAANNSGGPGGGININNFIDHAAAQHAPHYQPPAQGHRYHHGYYHHPSHYQVQQQQLQPPSSTPPPPPPPPPPTPQQQQQQQPPLSTSQHISFTTIPHSLSGGYAAPLTGELARIVANGNQHAYQGYYAANHSNLISQPHGRQQQQHSSSNNNNTNYNVGLQAAKKSPTYGSSSASSCSSSSTSSISSNCSNTSHRQENQNQQQAPQIKPSNLNLAIETLPAKSSHYQTSGGYSRQPYQHGQQNHNSHHYHRRQHNHHHQHHNQNSHQQQHQQHHQHQQQNQQQHQQKNQQQHQQKNQQQHQQKNQQQHHQKNQQQHQQQNQQQQVQQHQQLHQQQNPQQHQQLHQHQQQHHLQQLPLLPSNTKLPQHQNFYNVTYVSTDGHCSNVSSLNLASGSSRVCSPASSSMSVTSSSAPNHSSKLHDNNNGSGPTLMLSFNSANTNNYAQRYHQRGQHQQPHYQNQQSNIINNKKLLTPLSLTMSPLLPTPSPTNTICYVQLDELSTAVKTPISSSLPSNDISTPSQTHSNKLISTAVGNDYDSDTSSTKSSAVSGQGPQVKYQPLKSLSLSSSSSSSAASSISLSTPGTIDCSQTSTPAPSATPLLSPLDYNAYNSVLQTIPPSTTVHHNPQQHYQAQYQTHMLTYSRNVPTPASNQLNAQQLYRNGVISLLNLQTQNNGGMNSGIHTISQEDDYVQALQQQQQLAHHFYFSANSPSTGCDQATLGVTSALTASLTTSGGSGYWNPTQQANLLYNQTTNVSISPCLNDLDEFQTNSFSINQAMPSLSSSIGGGIYINNSTSNVHPKRGGSTQILSQQQQQHLIVQQQQQSSISLPGSSSTSITSLNTGMRIRTVGCNQQIQTSVITSAGNGSQQSPPAPAMQTHLFAHQPAPLQTVPQPSHNLIYSNPPTHMRTLTGATTNPSVHEFFTHTPPDRFLARAHLIEAKEAPPALLSNTKWDHLSQGIWKKFISSQQTEETFKQKMRLWRYLYLLIKNAYPRYGLYLVGSTISGFGADSSDVDMCLVSRSPSTIDPRMESLFNLTVLRDCLSKSGEFENFNLIEAKVPILRFRERIHQLEVDLNFNNCVGIKNTHLLYCYSQLDWRLRPLVLVIKLWAQYHNINNAKHMTISSYSLVLMVIHFLQYAVNPAVLPCLHDIYPDKFTLLRSNDFGYVDMNETIGHYESKNAQTLGELFLYFLEYYSCFDYAQFAISVRTGGLLPINVCRTAKSLKNDMHQWKELCIEEPFDLTNTARSVYDFETFERVKAVFVTSWRLLQQTLDLNSVFSTVIPSLQTNNKEDYEQQHIPTKSVLKEITLAATTTTVATMTYDNYCVLKNNNASLVTTGEVHNKDLSNYTSVQKQINSSTSTNSANNNANVANSTTSNSNLTTLIS